MKEEIVQQYLKVPGATFNKADECVAIPLPSDEEGSDGTIAIWFYRDLAMFNLIDIRSQTIPGFVEDPIGPTQELKINKGKVSVGGVDVSTVDPETLLGSFSIVFQDVTIFNNTVMENIRVGKKEATDEEVLNAARLANCDEFVQGLPNGYDTVIGENGSELSGGERQRISIARAFLKDAPIILLDEATASLDVENETKVQGALSRLIKNKTVMVIAHRMRTVAGANKIVVLSDGGVAEQGSPAELMQRSGIFAEMVQLQTEGQNWSIA